MGISKALDAKGRHLLGKVTDTLDYYEDYVVETHEEYVTGDMLIELVTPEGITVVVYTGQSDLQDALAKAEERV